MPSCVRILRLLCVLSVLSVLVPGPSVAADCPPAGGADLPFATAAEADGQGTTVAGGGWGHGVGMSQYGARGGGLAGCDAMQILQAYYPGSAVEAVDVADVVVLGLRSATTDSTTLRAVDGPVAWQVVGCEDPARCTEVPVQPAGASWQQHTEPDGTFRLVDLDGPVTVWQGGDRHGLLVADHVGTLVALPAVNRQVRWGRTVFDSVADGPGRTYVTVHIPAVDGLAAIDVYLRGLAEVPTSWPPATLQAQAVAARSYATRRIQRGLRDACRCHLYATTVDQHWAGAGHEQSDAAAGGRWAAAVAATGRQVLTVDGQVVDAYYSSSHGGWSEDAGHVWGRPARYLPAVDTSRWETWPGVANSRQRWTAQVTWAQWARAGRLDTATAVEVDRRGPGGRPTAADGGGVVVHGTRGGQPVSVRLTGEQLRTRLGLHSSLVRLPGEPTDPPAQPTAPTPSPTAPTATPTASPDPDPTASPVPTAGPDQAPGGPGVVDRGDHVRIHGPDRVATAAVVAGHTHPDGADVVLIARADDPADAVAAAPLAAAVNGPLLVTDPAGLSPAARTALADLSPQRVVLLGGTGAISDDVAQAVGAVTGADVSRIAGPTRSHTAAAIAQAVADTGRLSGVALVRTLDWPADTAWHDAVAVSGLAARRTATATNWAILLVGRDVPQVTRDTIATLAPRQVALVGAAAHTDLVAAYAAELDVPVLTWSGADQYATSQAVLDADRAASADGLLLVTGEAFPDGLVAGGLAAHDNLLLALTDPAGTTSQTLADLNRQVGGRPTVTGGPAALPDDVIATITR